MDRLEQFAIDKVDADGAGCSRLFTRFVAVAVLTSPGQHARCPRQRPERPVAGQLRLRVVVCHRRRAANICLLYTYIKL